MTGSAVNLGKGNWTRQPCRRWNGQSYSFFSCTLPYLATLPALCCFPLLNFSSSTWGPLLCSVLCKLHVFQWCYTNNSNKGWKAFPEIALSRTAAQLVTSSWIANLVLQLNRPVFGSCKRQSNYQNYKSSRESYFSLTHYSQCEGTVQKEHMGLRWGPADPHHHP